MEPALSEVGDMEQLFSKSDLADIAGIIKHFEQTTSCEIVVRITADRVMPEKAAREEFIRFGLDKADGRGILLYVNLFQHRFVLLAGDAIVEKLGEAWLQEHIDRLSDRFRKYRFGFGIHDLVSRMAIDLKEHFPPIEKVTT